MNFGSGTHRPWRHMAIAGLAAIAFCVSMLALPASRVEAQSVRGISIGVGGGLNLLNQLSKGGKSSAKSRSSKSNSAKKSKKTYASKKKGGSGSSSTAKKEDAEKTDEIAKDGDTAAGSDTAANPQPPASPEAAPAAAASSASGTALPAATAGSAAAAATAAAISSKSEIKAAQEHLKYMGYDVPALSGALDLKTKVAMMQFQDSIGEPSTGVLTTKQLQTLFVKVSEKTAASK